MHDWLFIPATIGIVLGTLGIIEGIAWLAAMTHQGGGKS